MIEIRRTEDGELCGFVAPRDGRWLALTVFGAAFGDHDARGAAEEHVRRRGLATLADPWLLQDSVTGETQVVCIQEAAPGGVRLALAPLAVVGVPTLTLTGADLDSDRWALRLAGAPTAHRLGHRGG